MTDQSISETQTNPVVKMTAMNRIDYLATRVSFSTFIGGAIGMSSGYYIGDLMAFNGYGELP